MINNGTISPENPRYQSIFIIVIYYDKNCYNYFIFCGKAFNINWSIDRQSWTISRPSKRSNSRVTLGHFYIYKNINLWIT